MSPNIKFGVSILRINTKHYIWLSYKRGVSANPLPYVSYTHRCKTLIKIDMVSFKNIFSSTNQDEDIGAKLYRTLYKADKNKLIDLIDRNNIDINSFVDFSNSDSILINATDCSSEYRNSKEQIDVINYLIDNNVDLNWKINMDIMHYT